MGIVETKLKGYLPPGTVGDGRYNVWMRNRDSKQDGGIMILTKKNLKVTEIVNVENRAELIAIKVENERKESREFVVTYVPPKNDSDHAIMLRETRCALSRVLDKTTKPLLMGDFNCKEVNWEDWTTEGGENSWGYTLLDLIMEHTMTQWIQQETRFRSDEQPSRLDLIFTKEPDIVKVVKYKPPINKSDHILMEMEIEDVLGEVRCEEYKEGRPMYSKTDFDGFKEYLRGTSWEELFNEEKTVEEKWRTLMEKYNEGVDKYVPKFKQHKVKYIKEWFNHKCRAAKEGRDRAWNRWRKGKHPRQWQEYTAKRNAYVNI